MTRKNEDFPKKGPVRDQRPQGWWPQDPWPRTYGPGAHASEGFLSWGRRSRAAGLGTAGPGPFQPAQKVEDYILGNGAPAPMGPMSRVNPQGGRAGCLFFRLVQIQNAVNLSCDSLTDLEKGVESRLWRPIWPKIALRNLHFVSSIPTFLGASDPKRKLQNLHFAPVFSSFRDAPDPQLSL